MVDSTYALLWFSDKCCKRYNLVDTLVIYKWEGSPIFLCVLQYQTRKVYCIGLKIIMEHIIAEPVR